MKVTILIPVYDDWGSLIKLIGEIHATMSSGTCRYELVIVDDASPTEIPLGAGLQSESGGCEGIILLRLRKNLGHQRAIAVGLVDIYSQLESDLVIVMDGDGEDSASDISRLIDACAATDLSTIVFARRTRRFDSALFKVGYECYCLLHRVAVGDVPRVGNFSALPYKFLSALVLDPNLWNHFPAAVYASRMPHATLPTARGRRFEGKSKLNFNALVVHGLSALACYSEKIGVRVLTATSVLLVLNVCGVFAVAGIRFFTSLAIPGWATAATGVLLILGFHLLTLGFAFCLIVLSRRQNVSFLPVRDVGIFISERRRL